MMYRILNDLKNNIRSLYPSSPYVSLNKFILHSLNYPEFKEVLKKYGADIAKIQKELSDYINQHELNKPPKLPSTSKIQFPNNNSINLDSEINSFIEDTFNKSNISQDNDLVYLFKKAENFEYQRLQKLMQENGGQLPSSTEIHVYTHLRSILDLAQNDSKFSYLHKILKDSKLNIDKFIKNYTAGKTKGSSVLDEICTNLNTQASEGKLLSVIGREAEIEQLTNILKKARKNNPVLVGKAGVGKTAIVEGLAKKIAEGNVPEAIRDAVIYELRIMDIVKGTTFRGQFEQKMSDLLEEFKELEASGVMPILFIDELHTIMGAGSTSQGGLDFSNIIKPALARGELRTIGSTTTDEWHKFIKSNPALDRRFISVSVKEPSIKECLEILNGSLWFYEQCHSVTYKKGTVERAVELTQQFIVDNALPDKAFDLIDYAGAMCCIKNKQEVTVDDIEYALAKHKNIDIEAVKSTRKDKLQPIAELVKESIFGQDHAVDKVTKAVEKALAGLNDKNKPYGAFLLTGPTGTGKTELSKQIAKAMNANFYRLDMSEFQEAHSISKLIGSPAGYIGYDDGSILTKVINENPRTVFLLDEIEKAHPSIYRLLLQIMDHGKLTDAKGKEINFRNVVLMMTSNAGVEVKSNSIGIGVNNEPGFFVNKKEIDKMFPPEFRGRLTGNAPIEFNGMTRDMLLKIVGKYMKEVQEERLDKIKVKVKLSAEVEEKLADLGMSKNLGARPVKEYIENEIVEPLSEHILYGKLKDLKKEKTVSVVMEDGKIKLKV